MHQASKKTNFFLSYFFTSDLSQHKRSTSGSTNFARLCRTTQKYTNFARPCRTQQNKNECIDGILCGSLHNRGINSDYILNTAHIRFCNLLFGGRLAYLQLFNWVSVSVWEMGKFPKFWNNQNFALSSWLLLVKVLLCLLAPYWLFVVGELGWLVYHYQCSVIHCSAG